MLPVPKGTHLTAFYNQLAFSCWDELLDPKSPSLQCADLALLKSSPESGVAFMEDEQDTYTQISANSGSKKVAK